MRRSWHMRCCAAVASDTASPKDRFLTVYGRKPVMEALADRTLTIDKVLLADNAHAPEILRAARDRGVAVQRATAQRVKVLAGNGKQDQGVLADVVAPRMRALTSALSSPPRTVLLLDGIFLHQDELAGCWDFSIFLQVPFAETARRMAARDGSVPDPDDPSLRRYVRAQRRYLAGCRPQSRANLLIDNTDVHRPVVLSLRPPS